MAGIGTAGLIVGILLGVIVILLGLLLAVSSGKAKPFLDEKGHALAGSISEKIHVNINGVQQGMFIIGKNVDNPVLLFIHGGTAMPEYFLTQNYPTGMEQYFTICWWDRRNAGLSYSANVPPETLTVEQSISDTLAVTKYLRSRFHKDKIYMMAHSGGSLIGIQAAARAPELFYAYIGVGQMSYQLQSEMLSYEYMVGRYKEIGNTRMVKQLEAAPPTMSVPLPAAYMKVRDSAMHSLGVGTTHDMKSVMTGVFLASWLFRGYTLGEKLALWRGKFSSDQMLWDKMIATDLTKQIQKLDLPVYFFHGKYDYTVSYSLAKAYLDRLQAPIKGFYTFEHSAHSPMFEEPDRMKQILQEDVLAGKNNRSDACTQTTRSCESN
ncbi:alpha/beta hydrolase [Chamaesiphon sp. OTE_75_metabat_556]|uniref:alpha/beta fold hydrolase n=1 Tax=Chamaesiphon sp. OTE_75_metabat_556 TaxID=2964692 RepID=UPI00286A011E|nr:alpha/beta hydrolase [Chamaesiphon sp. OTE_75_metabat_556]